MSAGSELIVGREGPIGWITFSNPARHNAMTLAMWQTLPVLLQELVEDAAIRVIVLKGAGEKAFVSGADISEFERERAEKSAVANYNRANAEANEALRSCAKPTLAMIRGYCIGGGLGLALACDLRIAAADASFAIPAAKLGLGYGFAGIKPLADLVGPAFAKEILFTARRIDAAEAARIGLVNRAVPIASLGAEVEEMAKTIAGNAPLTLAAAKECVAQWAALPERRDLARAEAAVAACFASRDYIEGRAAFRDKRKPGFTGR